MAAMEAGAQVYTTDFAISSALSLPLICLYWCLIGRLPFVMRSSKFRGHVKWRLENPSAPEAASDQYTHTHTLPAMGFCLKQSLYSNVLRRRHRLCVKQKPITVLVAETADARALRQPPEVSHPI